MFLLDAGEEENLPLPIVIILTLRQLQIKAHACQKPDSSEYRMTSGRFSGWPGLQSQTFAVIETF